MKPGHGFSFIVDEKISGRMERVVMINDGRLITKKISPEGIVYEVERT